MSVAELLAIAAAACLACAAVHDVRRFEIADGWSLGLAVLGFAHALAGPATWGPLVAPPLVFAAGLVLFARGWMGGGDVKLLTAASVWTGVGGLPALLLATALAGGGLALAAIAVRALPLADGPRVLERGAPLPYGVAIAIGAGWWGWTAILG